MTVTLLSQAPDVSSLKTRHVQKETLLVLTPPLVGHAGAIEGDLYISEDQFYFYSPMLESGIAVDYRDIVIHAISRQDQPSLYCQLDAGVFFPNQQLPEDAYDRQEALTELYLIPRDSGAGIDCKKERAVLIEMCSGRDVWGPVRVCCAASGQ
ncbi:hypothetical protein BY458DRAFT_496074 [Sporodiniella umbellata]|nr:hypothetical protein BY458DRAFT_496074 [Sporodiniella umbellata]